MSYSKVWYNERGTQPTYNTYPLITIDGSYVQKHGMSPLGVGPTKAPEPEEGVRGVFLSSGNVVVSSAMTMSGGTVGADYTMQAYRGGKVYEQTVEAYGKLRVYSGGYIESSWVSDNFLTVLEGGQAKDLVVGNSIKSTGSAAIYMSGALNGCTVEKRGYLHIRDNGTASNVTCLAGNLAVSSGLVTQVQIRSGVSVDVFGGTVCHVNSVSGGVMYISSGGAAYDVNMSSAGHLEVKPGAYAQDVVIDNNGYIGVFSGATASNVAVLGSASMTNTGDVYGGMQQDAYVHNKEGGRMYNFSGGPRISSGSYGENIIITSRATCRLFAGGLLNSGTVLLGGILQISAGTASEIVVLSGGTIMVSSGASALSITSEAGARVDSKTGAYITYKQE